MKLLQLSPKTRAQIATKIAKNIHKNCVCFVYPTDTAYGLGVNALNVKCLKKLYEIKERGESKPTHVIVRDWEMIESLCHTNKLARILYDKFLPGPLTIILPKKDIVPDELTGGLPTLGVRIPDHPFTLELMKHVDSPITTPSANRSGDPTPYSADDVKKSLDVSKLDFIIDGGKLTPTPPSTLVDLSGDEVKILREGPITKKQIHEALSLS